MSIYPMSIAVRSCCTAAGFATIVAVTATVTGSVPQVLSHQPVKTRSVGIPLLALEGLDTAIPVTSWTAQPAVGAPDSSVGASPAAATQANATNPLSGLLRTAAAFAISAANVLWLLAFPITFPVGFIWGQIAYPGTGISWPGLLALPYLLGLQYLLPALPASATGAPDSSGVSGRPARSSASVIKTLGAPAVRDQGSRQVVGGQATAAKPTRSTKAAAAAKTTSKKTGSAAARRSPRG